MRRRPGTSSGEPSSRTRASLSAPKNVTERKIERRDPRAIREAAMAKKMARFGRAPPPGPAARSQPRTTQVTTQTQQSTTRVTGAVEGGSSPLADVPEEDEGGEAQPPPPPPPATVTQETTTRTRKVQKIVRKKNLLGVLHPDLQYLERGEQPPERPREPMPEIPANRRLPPDQFQIYKAWEAYNEYLYQLKTWKQNKKYEPADVRYEKEAEKALMDAEKQYQRDYRMGKMKGSAWAAFLMGEKGAMPPRFEGESEEDYQAFLRSQEPEPERPAGRPPGRNQTSAKPRPTRAKTLAVAKARAGGGTSRLSAPKHTPPPTRKFLQRGGGRTGTTVPIKTVGRGRKARTVARTVTETSQQPEVPQTPRYTPENLRNVSGRRFEYTPGYPPPPLGGLEAYEEWLREVGEERRAAVQQRREAAQMNRQHRMMKERWGDRVREVYHYDPDMPVCPQPEYDPTIDYDAGVELEELGVFGPETPASVYAYEPSPRVATPGTPPVPWVTPRMPWVTPQPDDFVGTPYQPIAGPVSPWRTPKSRPRKMFYRRHYDDDDVERRLSWGHSPSPILVPPVDEPLSYSPVELAEPEPEEYYIPWVTPEPRWYESPPYEEDRFLQIGYRPPTAPRPREQPCEPVIDEEIRLGRVLETPAPVQQPPTPREEDHISPRLGRMGQSPRLHEFDLDHIRRPLPSLPKAREYGPEDLEMSPQRLNTPHRLTKHLFTPQHPIYEFARRPAPARQLTRAEGEEYTEDLAAVEQEAPTWRTPKYLREIRERLKATQSRASPVSRFELSFPSPEVRELQPFDELVGPLKTRLLREMRTVGIPEAERLLMGERRPLTQPPSRHSPLINIEDEEPLFVCDDDIPYEDDGGAEGAIDWFDDGGAADVDEVDEPFDWLQWNQPAPVPQQVPYGPAGRELLDEMEYNRQEYARLGLGDYGQELLRYMSSWGDPQVVCPPSPRF